MMSMRKEREKSVCMKYWRERQCTIVLGSREFYFICSCIFCEIYFYRTVWKRSLIVTHRIVVFSVRSGTDEWEEANERERREVVFSIGILWEQTRRGSFRPTDKKGGGDFSNRFVRYFILSCWVCWVQGRKWGKRQKKNEHFLIFPLDSPFIVMFDLIFIMYSLACISATFLLIAMCCVVWYTSSNRK